MMHWRALTRGCLFLLLVGTPVLRSVPAAADDPTDVVPGEVLLAVPPLTDDTGLRAAMAAGLGSAVAFEPGLGVYRFKLRADLGMEQALGLLQRLPGIRYVEPNIVVQAAIAPSDPYGPRQYGPQKIQAYTAWEIWKPQSPIIIAIADTGIDSSHPDLTRKILRDDDGIVGFDAFAQQRGDASDDYYHGTHCAGIAAAETGNGTGIAGVAGWDGATGADAGYIRLMPVKVLDSNGSGTSYAIATGVRWAADHGAQVISLSLGGSSYSQTQASAMSYAISKGCVVVAAAGNSASDLPFYPAGFGGVISVAATDSTDMLTSFSNYGTSVTTAAPGALIVSTTPTSATAAMGRRGVSTSYATISGTSMSCPHVAGEAALILSQNPQLSPSQVRNLVASNVDPYTPYQGRMLAPGAGRVNVRKALAAAGVGRGSGLPTSAPPAVTSLSLTPTSLIGGGTSTGRVSLSAVAPSGGTVVTLASSDTAAATVPPSVTVPAGAASASFTVSTSAVPASTFADISATLDASSRSARLSITSESYGPSSITLGANGIVGGNSVTGTVSIRSAAPSDIVMNLASSASAATVPATVTIPAGKASAPFTVKTKGVASKVSVTISASRVGVTQSVDLTVGPAILAGISFSPSSISGGSSTTGRLTLNGSAPPGGAVIALSSSRSDLAPVPATVTIPAGATSASFSVRTKATFPPPTTPISVGMTARYAGLSKTATLSVK